MRMSLCQINLRACRGCRIIASNRYGPKRAWQRSLSVTAKLKARTVPASIIVRVTLAGPGPASIARPSDDLPRACQHEMSDIQPPPYHARP